MQLSSQQVERFYRIWFALLRFVNDRSELISAFPARGQEATLSVADEMQLRHALWADEALLEDFVATNAAGLSRRDLAIVTSWRDRLTGGFFVMRALKTSTVFLSDRPPPHAYGVLGLLRPIEEAVGLSLPFYTQAVLLPFEGQITYDGLLQSSAVSFGPGIRRRLSEAYHNAKEREGIITSLKRTLPISVDEQRTQIEDRNAKLLQAFGKHLTKAGLSLKMVEQHVSMIGAFAQAVLLSQDPPRGLLEMTPADLQAYLHSARTPPATSFKRFVRFLTETGRMEYEQAQALRQVLKQM